MRIKEAIYTERIGLLALALFVAICTVIGGVIVGPMLDTLALFIRLFIYGLRI